MKEKAERWMALAVREAKTALTVGEVPVGAVFVQHPTTDPHILEAYDVDNGSVVSTGYNLTNETRNVRLFRANFPNSALR
jgi:tRNA(Arg) A34 adenosine deaminase TadA